MAPEDLTIEHGPDVSWHITIYRSGPYNLTFTDISAIFIYFQVHRYIMRGVKWERIIRVLLNDPEGSLTKYRVAKLSGCSIGWTMEYLGRMEREGLIAGTRVEDFKGLVELWAEAAPRPAHRAFNHPRPADLLSRTGMDYALTTYIADDILHHYLFPSRWDLYVRADDVDRWRTVLAGEGMVGAGNMRLLLHDDHALYNRQRIDGLWVASVPQVLVDLRREGGVCGEAYELMLDAHLSRL
jgi:hypothetical protein